VDDRLINADDGAWPLVARSFDGVVVVAPSQWRVVYANQAAANSLGLSLVEIVGKPIGELIEARASQSLIAQIESAVSGVAMDARVVFKGDCPRDVRICLAAVDGRPLVGIILHIAPRRQDPVTGLPDRDFLMSHLAELLRERQPENHQFAVLFVDVNNFKEVNDRHGHLIGDRVLAEAARRLSQCLPVGGHVVRFGGDEFVVLLERVAEKEEIRSVIERIESAVAHPIAVPDGEVTLSLSIGVAISSPEFRTPEEILTAADRAMYASKRGGNS
jgi:diguanylate cyclase (GGDEF)-like protein